MISYMDRALIGKAEEKNEREVDCQRNRQETWLHGGLRMIQAYKEVEIRIGLKTKAEALKKKNYRNRRKGIRKLVFNILFILCMFSKCI